jgi:hypothetical protein
MSWHDFFYYTLIKHGKILIAILGIIIAILVFMFAQKFGMDYQSSAETAYTACGTDEECFEWCGKCVSTSGARVCEPNETISCTCINEKCTIT